MPVSLLIALFLAFGTDAILPPSPIPRGSVVPRLIEAMAEVGLVGLAALAFATLVLGMVLPAALIFSLAQDLARRFLPSLSEDPGFQMGMMAAMGALVLVLAPAFVRLSWPTRPLPDGPLRDRLERLSARFGFRYTDI